MFSCSGTILSSVCIKSLSALRYDVYCVLFLILSYLPKSHCWLTVRMQLLWKNSCYKIVGLDSYVLVVDMMRCTPNIINIRVEVFCSSGWFDESYHINFLSSLGNLYPGVTQHWVSLPCHCLPLELRLLAQLRNAIKVSLSWQSVWHGS
jgi:hypothetical protein